MEKQQMEPQNNTLRARTDGDQIRNRIRWFVTAYTTKHGAQPSTREIARHMGRSEPATRFHLRIMRDRGY
jgi:hypothetical protein